MLCGIDEAGRGSVMGPLVVGVVWTGDEDVLARIGVRDSKKLTPKTRERMYAEIVASADAWTVVVASAADVDSRRREMSLNDVELLMFAEAVRSRPCDEVYADCPDVNEAKFSSRLHALAGGCAVIAKHKADDTYPVVSAASIVAKVTRDRMVEDLRGELGDFGSGYPSDGETMDFIARWIRDNGSPPPHARTSWEPVRRMMSARSTRRLDDW